MITVEQLSKTFQSPHGPVHAVDDISLEVDRGEVFGILGPSGAGKSTLLRCLNLLERPTAGRVLLDGEDLTALGPKALRDRRRDMGMVFQQFNLLHARTVADNVDFPLEIAGMPRRERDARVAELLDLVGLTERAKAHPGQLSGGQRQRVGIARALAARPKVLLCDEATSALDTETTVQILDLLAEVNRRLGVTIALITHELEVIRRICHSAALLDAGRIAESGKVVDLVTDPRSPLGEAILPTGGPDDYPLTAILAFDADHVSGALISQITRDLDLDVSLIGGGLERLAGHEVGRLRVGISHPGDPASAPDKARVEDYLRGRGIPALVHARGDAP
ncbi:methionine ABC transporter ATP-binding protein [Actinomycetota bacterium]